MDFSVNDKPPGGLASAAGVGKKKKKAGIRFGGDEIHEFDKERAADTHLSLEKPLNLPFVPPNSLRSGWNWNTLPPLDEDEDEAPAAAPLDSDEELDRAMESQLDQDPINVDEQEDDEWGDEGIGADDSGYSVHNGFSAD